MDIQNKTADDLRKEFYQRIATQEAQREADIKKWERRQEKIDRKLDALGVGSGLAAENFFEGATEDGIAINGIKFEQASVNLVIMDGLQHKAECDLVFNNGEYILLLEVKYRLDKKHIHSLDEVIAAIKKYEPELIEGKTILTGFASLAVREEIKKEFIAAGHYILTQDGEKAKVEGKPL